MAKPNEIPMGLVSEMLEICTDSPSGLKWKEGVNEGMVCGSKQINSGRGYFQVRLGDKRYKAHRLVASISLGFAIPTTMCVDHIDGNTSNNHPTNLRVCTQSENCRNQKLSKASKSGVKGVQKIGNGWMARVGPKYIGYYKTIEDAAEAYRTAAESIHGVFARVA